MSTVWNAILSPGMFSESFMINTWISGTIVAVISGIIGFSSSCADRPSLRTLCRKADLRVPQGPLC